MAASPSVNKYPPSGTPPARALILAAPRDEDTAQWWHMAGSSTDVPAILLPLLRGIRRASAILATFAEAWPAQQWACLVPGWECGEHGEKRPLIFRWEGSPGEFGG